MAVSPDTAQATVAEIQRWGLDGIEASAPGPAAGSERMSLGAQVGRIVADWFSPRQAAAEEIQSDTPLFSRPVGE